MEDTQVTLEQLAYIIQHCLIDKPSDSFNETMARNMTKKELVKYAKDSPTVTAEIIKRLTQTPAYGKATLT